MRAHPEGCLQKDSRDSSTYLQTHSWLLELLPRALSLEYGPSGCRPAEKAPRPKADTVGQPRELPTASDWAEVDGDVLQDPGFNHWWFKTNLKFKSNANDELQESTMCRNEKVTTIRDWITIMWRINVIQLQHNYIERSCIVYFRLKVTWIWHWF